MDFFCFSEACLIADVVQHFGNSFRSSEILGKKWPEATLFKNAEGEGKELFWMTNSPYYFVDGGMRFIYVGVVLACQCSRLLHLGSHNLLNGARLSQVLKLNIVSDMVTSLVSTLHFFYCNSISHYNKTNMA
ncbi:hypothetical protein MKX03_007038 [Papaver bracteatum]|nr:hypothetical protein MKX03_007038 [Papaver bracteatum]